MSIIPMSVSFVGQLMICNKHIILYRENTCEKSSSPF